MAAASAAAGAAASPAVSVWRIVREFARRRPWLVAANVAFMAFVPVNEVLLPHTYGRLVDAVRGGRPHGGALLAVVAVLIVGQAGSLLRDWADTWTEPALEGFMREELLRAIIESHDGRFVHDQHTGEIVSKFTRMPSIATGWVKRITDYVLPYVLVLAAAAAYCWRHDGVLAWSLVALAAALAALLWFSGGTCAPTTLAREAVFDELHERVEETLRNLPSVYSGNETARALSELRGANDAYRAAYAATMRCAVLAKVVGYAAIVTFFAAFALRACELVAARRMAVSVFVPLFMVVSYLLGSLWWVVSIVRDVIFEYGTLADTERVAAPPPPTPHAPPPRAEAAPGRPPHAGGLGLVGVSYTPPGRRAPVLDRATLHFEEGETTALVGPIGAGKSTVLKLLLRFLEPDSGRLYLQGRWYDELPRDELRARVAYVSQDTVLFNRSVLDNVLYGNPGADEAAAEQLMFDLGVADEFANLPRGVRSAVGKNGSRLSGGQRQLVWVLRALFKDPEVLLLDEPTTSMDAGTKALVVRLLHTVMRGRTVVMVTHDPYLERFATRRVRIGP